MTEPDGRRRRVALSCTLCRKRKMRCNRENPCSNCLRSRSETCIYENQKHTPTLDNQVLLQNRANGRILIPRTHRTPYSDLTSSVSESTQTRPTHTSKSPTSVASSMSTPGSRQSVTDAELAKPKHRVRQFEDQMANLAPSQAQPPPLPFDANMISTSTHLGGTMHINYDSSAPGQSQAIARSVVQKNRLLGQSHWCVNNILLLRDLFHIMEPRLLKESSSAISTLEQCKSRARVIKARRAPSWPCPPSPDLPTKEVADTLLDNYLRTSESVYRIIHIPTFRKDYDELWVSNNTRNTAFIIRLKLILAIGTITYDDHFSLRTKAIRWVYEAQTWVAEPKFKSRLDIGSLQTNLLLLLAQEGVGVRGDNMWISIGALLRKTIFMGLHRDPESLPPMTNFAREMRRRLWNTTIELALQSSLTCGGPPLISTEEFDAAPPGNFEDDQLMIDQAVPKPENEFTQTSIAIALRKTFPQRLAVVKFLNNTSSLHSYDETLHLDTELRTAYKVLWKSLKIGQIPNNQDSSSKIDIYLVNFILHRYLLALHAPYFGPAFHETGFTYSRKVVIESCLKIWHTVCPESSTMGIKSGATKTSNDWNGLSRLATCSTGFYPSVTVQSIFLIALELRQQVQEDDGMGFTSLRPDLLSVLDDGMAWCKRVVEAGETNVKGCLLIGLVIAHLDALRKGMKKEDIAEALVRTMEELGSTCLAMVEEAAARDDYGDVEDGFETGSATTPIEGMEDWDFMMSEALLGGGDIDPMNWMFGQE